MLRLLRRADLGLLQRIRLRDVPGIVVIGDVHGDVHQHAGQAQRLALGWRELGPHQDPLDWLHWKSRMSPKVLGREREMASLRRWAEEGRPVRARVLFGEGGTGKTRLAAELAQELREAGWEAGFAALRRVEKGAEVYRTGSEGTLILLDYPEEHREATRELLEDLASLETEERIRVLLLSRRGDELWQPEIDRAGAFGLFDEVALELGPLEEHHLFEVFEESAKNLANKANAGTPAPIDQPTFGEWLRKESVHRRPLYAIAAAIEAALEPSRPVVTLTGREVIQALARRELKRLANESRDAGLPGEAFPRLTALAVIAGGLTTNGIRRLAEVAELELGLLAPTEAITSLARSGRLVQDDKIRRLPAPAPDLVAAALVVDVLSAEPELAPERLWAAIQGDLEGGLARIGRLAHDAEVVLGLLDDRMSAWLETALTRRPDRCATARAGFEEVTLPYGLQRAAPAVWRGLLEAERSEEERAGLSTSLSNHLSDVGDPSGALVAIEEAVAISRRLADSNPAGYEPELASSLNNLSNRLSDIGESSDALVTIEEAVGIYRRLADPSPSRHEPELAASLNNLSLRLSDVGDSSGALDAIEEAVAIRSRLADSNPSRHQPDLAVSLNNLSVHLSGAGDASGALDAIKEAVAIYRGLAGSNPARYEPELALSLNNLSLRLFDAGDGLGALNAIKEAVGIYRSLAGSNPARYEPELASGLTNLSVYLTATGDASGAREAIEEAVGIRRRLAASNPARYEPDLARSLGLLSRLLADAGRVADAWEAVGEAWRLLQPYAERWPDSPHGRLGGVIQDDLRRLEERLAEDEPGEGTTGPDSTPSA